nr:hypothetical protein [Rhodocyclus tenuis]
MCDGICQRRIAAAHGGGVTRHHNLIDQRLQVALGKGFIRELRPDRLAEGFDVARQNALHWQRVRAPHPGQLDHQRFPLGLQFLRPFLQSLIEGQAVLDRRVEIALCRFRLLQQPVQLVDLVLLRVLGVARALSQLRDQLMQPIRCADPICQLLDDQPVELVFGEVAALAGVIALALPVRALVVAIAPALARHQRYRMAAGALQEAGEQGRAGDDARRRVLRRTCLA